MQTVQSIFEYHDLIEAIVAAIEMRDIHTLHHSERVSNMTECICQCLKLSAEECRICHIAADLHDIGKIGVCDAVLLKRGPLDENEWGEMQSHAMIGSYILGKVERFATIAQIVRHHHERWDGTGYPDHFAGEQIPLGARIIAVADSIDAMLSDRSYRQALSIEACRQEIKGNLGKMYDPSIAAVALKNWTDVLNARRKSVHIQISEELFTECHLRGWSGMTGKLERAAVVPDTPRVPNTILRMSEPTMSRVPTDNRDVSCLK